MIQKSLAFIVCLFLYIQINAQDILSGDSLRNDFRYFVKSLEETHPDPYSAFGGKVAFHLEADRIGKLLQNGNHTKKDFAIIASSFLSTLKDGHSFIGTDVMLDKEGKEYKYIPLSFKVIPGGLILNALPKSHTNYIGSKLLTINNIPVDTVCARLSKMVPAENIYNSYKNLSTFLQNSPSLISQILDINEQDINIEIEVSMVEYGNKIISFPFVNNKDWKESDNIISAPVSVANPKDYINYRYLNNDIMYFRMSSIASRECFMYMQEKKMPLLESFLQNVYRKDMKQEMPGDMDFAIKNLPCLAEIFRNMLEDMKQNKTGNLIVDLRGNSGGFTPILHSTLYMLFGDKYLNKNLEARFIRMVSPLWMKKNNITLEEYNRKNNTNYSYGDYIIPSYEKDFRDNEQKRADFIQNQMGNISSYLEDLNGKPICDLKNIYVLIDEKTFSAAFHYAYYLREMGAKVIGVPPSQSPNAFMEGTSFHLPFTKINASFSNSIQYLYTESDERAKIFWTDIKLQYKDYKKYKFDQDTEILWLIDHINAIH